MAGYRALHSPLFLPRTKRTFLVAEVVFEPANRITWQRLRFGVLEIIRRPTQEDKNTEISR